MATPHLHGSWFSQSGPIRCDPRWDGEGAAFLSYQRDADAFGTLLQRIIGFYQQGVTAETGVFGRYFRLAPHAPTTPSQGVAIQHQGFVTASYPKQGHMTQRSVAGRIPSQYDTSRYRANADANSVGMYLRAGAVRQGTAHYLR